jgi:hypothetical protein
MEKKWTFKVQENMSLGYEENMDVTNKYTKGTTPKECKRWTRNEQTNKYIYKLCYNKLTLSKIYNKKRIKTIKQIPLCSSIISSCCCQNLQQLQVSIKLVVAKAIKESNQFEGLEKTSVKPSQNNYWQINNRFCCLLLMDVSCQTPPKLTLFQ